MTQPNDETEPLPQVGWYCWRCEGINAQACRSDAVPIHVPAEWADDMQREIDRLEDEDDEPKDVTQLEQLRAEADAWRRKAIRRALGTSKLRGAIEGCRDLVGEDVTRTDAWGDGYREAINDLREILQAFGQLEVAHDGPSIAEAAAGTRPLREQQARPADPDGTPYGYADMVAEGWEFCDGCRVWTTATPEQPHQCAQTYIHGPVGLDAGPTVAEAAADDHAHWNDKYAGEGDR